MRPAAVSVRAIRVSGDFFSTQGPQCPSKSRHCEWQWRPNLPREERAGDVPCRRRIEKAHSIRPPGPPMRPGGFLLCRTEEPVTLLQEARQHRTIKARERDALRPFEIIGPE